jgi:hypothetical protein
MDGIGSYPLCQRTPEARGFAMARVNDVLLGWEPPIARGGMPSRGCGGVTPVAADIFPPARDVTAESSMY